MQLLLKIVRRYLAKLLSYVLPQNRHLFTDGTVFFSLSDSRGSIIFIECHN